MYHQILIWCNLIQSAKMASQRDQQDHLWFKDQISLHHQHQPSMTKVNANINTSHQIQTWCNLIQIARMAKNQRDQQNQLWFKDQTSVIHQHLPSTITINASILMFHQIQIWCNLIQIAHQNQKIRRVTQQPSKKDLQSQLHWLKDLISLHHQRLLSRIKIIVVINMYHQMVT